jgi:hypothetical protein
MKPQRVISTLVDKECWLITAGKGTGAVIALHFGKRVPRERWITNPTLRPEARQFEGEFVLQIECPWRIDAAAEVVTSWSDDNSIDGPMLSGLERLQGQRVLECRLREPANDLAITFTNGLCLRTFADQGAASRADNYMLMLPHSVLVNGPGYRIFQEARSS